MVMDRFIRSLPVAARERVAETDPSTLDDTIAALERYTAAQVLGHADRQVQEKRGTTPVKSRVRLDPKPAPGDDRHREPQGPYRHLPGKQEAPAVATNQQESLQCFRCGTRGHIARQCRRHSPERMDVGHSQSIPCLQTSSVSTDPFIVKVRVEGQEVVALIDSGSSETLVTRDLVPLEKYTQDSKDVYIRCIHGDIKPYPTVVIGVEVVGQSFFVKVGVVPALPFAMIIGKNCPQFLELVKVGAGL